MSQSDYESKQTFVVHAGYEAFAFGITLLTVVNSVLLFLQRPADTQAVAGIMNNMLYAFLMADALYRFFRHRDRFNWLIQGWGWMIFAGSLPIPFAGVLRLVFVWLWVRRLRRSDMLVVRDTITAKRAQSTLLSLILTAIVVFEIAGILILKAESADPNANIKNANDALWWGYVTIATVGYGDRYPVTTDGRIIGIAVITVGVALFSGITGYLADWFRRPRAPKPARWAKRNFQAAAQPEDVPSLIAAIRSAIDAKEQADQSAFTDLRARLDALERQVNQH
jgi:voltage-gated potassium channel